MPMWGRLLGTSGRSLILFYFSSVEGGRDQESGKEKKSTKNWQSKKVNAALTLNDLPLVKKSTLLWICVVLVYFDAFGRNVCFTRMLFDFSQKIPETF